MGKLLWKVGVYLQVNVATYIQRGYNCPIRGALKLIWWFCSAVLVVVGECGKIDGVWWYVCGKKFRKNFRLES